jgi:DUF1009 family protein
MSSSEPQAKLGIVAGRGSLPALLVAACKADHRDYFVLGLKGFADAETLPVDSWVRITDVSQGFAALNAAQVKDVVMAGGVQRPSLSDLKFDLKGAAFLARIAGRALGDDGLLSAVVGEFERQGFNVVGADSIVSQLLTPEGVIGRHVPDTAAWADITLGMDAARKLGAADIGQAVIVQQGVVIGEEGVDGTDALIARCASLRRQESGGVLVKAKKPQQERRADLPTIGVATVHNCRAAGLSGIAVEAGHTLMLGRDEIVAAADAAGLFVVGVK